MGCRPWHVGIDHAQKRPGVVNQLLDNRNNNSNE